MLKEPEIKLFGRKISLPDNGTVTAGGEFSDDSSIESSNGSGGNVGCDSCLEVGRKQEREGVREREDSEEKQEQGDEDQATGELCETTPEDENQNPEDSKSPNVVSESDDNRKTPSNDDGSVAENQPEPENEQSGSTNGQQKTLKKPDKILPCPRCNSMDTKFCYYNNYNVNQPRHLCKSCQRYWTAGGTTRNVPVGAGRRKSKNSGSNFRHIMISEALQPTQIDTPNGLHNLKLRPNGTVLSFGTDTPLRESLASALNLAEKRVPIGARNGVCKIDQGGLVSSGNGESSDDFSMGSGEGKKNVPVMPKGNGFPSPIPCIPGVPWPFPWNSAVTIPTFCPPGYPLPYYMAPFWNYGVPNAWSIPWVPVPSTTAHQNGAGAGAGSMSPLGKHSRNGELIRPNKSESQEQSESRSSESSIVIPKTLRIDDPEDAAKSSIWSTLGIKCDSFRRECLLKALQPKGDEKKPMVTTSPLLQANPAALSRSISFHERA